MSDTKLSKEFPSIAALDLEPIKIKLIDSKSGPGWTLEKADEVEKDYKRFLALVSKHSDQKFIPSDEIDEFWHNHILDTRKYTEDCQNVFGHYLHHFPYLGMHSAEDYAHAQQLWFNTQIVFKQEFGVRINEANGGFANCKDCIAEPSCDADRGSDVPDGQEIRPRPVCVSQITT